MLSTDPDPKNIPNTGYVLAIVLIVLAIAVPVLLVAAVVVIFVVAYKRAKGIIDRHICGIQRAICVSFYVINMALCF